MRKSVIDKSNEFASIGAIALTAGCSPEDKYVRTNKSNAENENAKEKKERYDRLQGN
jgi:hypothetical protein